MSMYASLVLVFAVLPPLDVYRPLKKNGLRSRDLQCFDGASIRLECTCMLQTPTTSLSAAAASPCGVINMFNYHSIVSIATPAAQAKQAQPRPNHPQPDAMFCTSLAREVAYKYAPPCPPALQFCNILPTLQFCNIQHRYSLSAIADGGPHPSDWLSTVIQGGAVLFIESDQQRWSLRAAAGGAAPLAVDVSICTQPQDFNSPTNVLHAAVAWQRLQWSPRGLQIVGTNSGATRGGGAGGGGGGGGGGDDDDVRRLALVQWFGSMSCVRCVCNRPRITHTTRRCRAAGEAVLLGGCGALVARLPCCARVWRVCACVCARGRHRKHALHRLPR